MAYMNRPRESMNAARRDDEALSVRARLRSWRSRAHRLRDRLPMGCLLCDTRTPGGLCRYCEAAVCASMEAEVRCPRCDLRLSGSVCPDCPGFSPALKRVVAAFDYEWPGDLLIRRLKLQGRFVCAPLLARMMAERLQLVKHDLALPPPRVPVVGDTPAAAQDWVVTAVPASRASIVLRGYNPAAELGRALARRLNVEWRPDLISRVKDGSAQKGLARAARRIEVQGLYRASEDAAGRAVLVVDDVMTTGSTLDAIAMALAGQGAVAVWGVVAARTGTARKNVDP